MLKKKPEKKQVTIMITDANLKKVDRLEKKYNLSRGEVIDGIITDYDENHGGCNEEKQKNKQA